MDVDGILPTMQEEWRPVKGYEQFYEVSNLGRVRSLDRTIVTQGQRWVGPSKRQVVIRRERRGKLLSPKVNADGYRAVNLIVDGKPKTRYVHRLVLEAFVGAPSDAQWQAGHLNGTPGDDRADNLAWVTRSTNMEHRRQHGSAYFQPAVLLKRRAVLALHRDGFTPAEIADCLKLRVTSVWRQVEQSRVCP